MNKYTLRLLTVCVLVGVSIGLCLFDFWMSWTDNDATISKIFLWLATRTPVTSMVVAFWCGSLCGHLFYPQDPLSTP